MIEETIELLTKMMIEEDFKSKQNNEKELFTMTKTQLYKFCIKLIKVLQNVEEIK